MALENGIFGRVKSELAKFYDLRGEHLLGEKNYRHAKRFEDETRLNVLRLTESLLFLWRQERKSVLDLCCGVGVYSLYPAQIGFEVDGVDLSPKSIEASRFLAKETQLEERCHFQVADVLEFLKNDAKKYDVIQIHAAIYYFDRHEILKLIREKLEPNGRFLCIETSGSQPLANLWRFVRGILSHSRDKKSIQNLTRLKDLKTFCEIFPKTEVAYIDCFSMLALPLKKFRRLSHLVYVTGAAIDRVLIDRLHLKFLAFRFVIWSEK